MRLGLAQSRRQARELVASGRVRVNGHYLRKGRNVTNGDHVEVAGNLTSPEIISNRDLLVPILFADPALLVVNKPGLMPCHPLRPEERDTVINAVVTKYPEAAFSGNKPLEGGLIHRLDNGTSGALMIARNLDSFLKLRAALKNMNIRRVYQALVTGEMQAEREVLTPIVHHPKNRRKMITDLNGYIANARPAATCVRPLAHYSGFTLVEVLPRTGSRHQIRVHLASIGYPLAGDTLYGGPAIEGFAPGRFWLHLAALDVNSPASGRVHVEASLPPDLAKVLRIRVANS